MVPRVITADYHAASASSKLPSNMPPSRVAVRKPRSRVFTGCFTCRARKKKCDEQNPRCIACTRNELVCEWPELKNKSRQSELRSTSERSPQLLAPSIAGVLSPQADSAPQQEAPLESDSHPTKYPTPLAAPPPDDEASRLRIATEILDSRFLSPVPLLNQQTFEIGISSAQHTVPRLRLLETNFPARIYELLDQYINTTAPQLAVYRCTREQNPFIELLIPLAFQYQIVLDSILALAAAHTAATDARRLYGSVLAKLRLALLTGQSSTSVLVATMMLCLFETAEGESRETAITHLKALVRLLDDRHRAKTQTIHDDLVLECLVYHSVTTGVFSDSAFRIMEPLLPDSDPSIFTGWDALDSFEPRTNVLCGASWDILKILLRISRLYRQTSGGSMLKTKDYLEGLQIASELSAWTPVALEKTQTACMADNINYETLSLSAKLWQMAAFVSLLLVMNNSSISPFDMRITDVVKDFVTILAEVPQGCAVETCLNWPLVVVGSYAVQFDQRTTISNRFRDMEWLGFRNIALAEKILQITWHVYDETGELNIEQNMRNHGFEIILS